MFKVILALVVLLIMFILYRLYGFFKVTDAPILKGKLDCNVGYKKGKKLDIYLPTKEVYGKMPVLVHFHGGGWIMGSKMFVNNSRFHGAFNELRERGYAIISPKYTLARNNQSPFPACLTDAHDALAWIEKNAGEYNFDLNNIGIMGESAGGHIALMTGYCRPQEFSAEHSIKLKYIVDVYGPAELYALYNEMAPVLNNIDTATEKWPRIIRSQLNIKRKLFGFDPSEDEDKTRNFANRFSPSHKVSSESPPTIMIHGDRDQLVPVTQSFILKRKLEELNVPHEMHILEKVGHAFRGASGKQRTEIQYWILEFVVKNYSEK